MKKRHFIIQVLLGILLGVFVSCSEYDPYVDNLRSKNFEVSTESITLGNGEKSGEFTVISNNIDWYICPSAYWIHINGSYVGHYSESIRFTVDDNNSEKDRNGYITVYTFDPVHTEYIINIKQHPTAFNAFTITKVEVANIDYSGNIINDYGTTIYSSQTKYLQPKLYIKVNRAGTYTVSTKLYTPSGVMSQGTSSPSGYTYSCDITINSYTTSRELWGWGGNTAGHWRAGNYRWEFYLDGVKIGEKSFKIY